MFVLNAYKKQLVKKIGIAVGVIVLLALFIMLLNMDINKRIAAVTEAKTAIALRNQAIELLTGANSDLKKAEPLMVELQSFLPAKDELINFPRELQRIGQQYLVDVGFSFGTEELGKDGKAGNIKFTLTIDGTYDSIVDFLKYVEGHKYLISLDSVDLRSSGRDNFSLFTSGQIYTK